MYDSLEKMKEYEHCSKRFFHMLTFQDLLTADVCTVCIIFWLLMKLEDVEILFQLILLETKKVCGR